MSGDHAFRGASATLEAWGGQLTTCSTRRWLCLSRIAENLWRSSSRVSMRASPSVPNVNGQPRSSVVSRESKQARRRAFRCMRLSSDCIVRHTDDEPSARGRRRGGHGSRRPGSVLQGTRGDSSRAAIRRRGRSGLPRPRGESGRWSEPSSSRISDPGQASIPRAISICCRLLRRWRHGSCGRIRSSPAATWILAIEVALSAHALRQRVKPANTTEFGL